MIKDRISVRDLAEFNNKDGSLGGNILNSSRAQIGTLEHKRVQDSRGEGYLKEYSLKTSVEKFGIMLEIYGRADGIYSLDDPIVIEEIKTTKVDKISAPHLSQVKLYAYLYLIESSLKGVHYPGISIKLLYINIINREERIIKEYLTREELTIFFETQIDPYFLYLKGLKSWKDLRDTSLKELVFPFNNFREGQRDLSVNIFRAIRDSKTLFSIAPTGTGKSMASIFPALKAMGEGVVEKIFYLTAKTVGRITARDTINILREGGANIRSIVITAKEKICINKEFNCSPDSCPYALDYYKKLFLVINEILGIRDFYEENLKDLGEQYSLCPFELSLDLSNYCDIVICDYNYVFDLRVYLKRYFETKNKGFTLLVDEAHNLPDRLRSSYSCKLDRELIPPVLDILSPICKKTMNSLEAINSIMLDAIKSNSGEYTLFEEVPTDLIKALKKSCLNIEGNILDLDFKGKNLVIDWYFNTLFFIKLSELYTEGHCFVQVNRGGLGVTLEILCNDPSILFSKMLQKCNSHIFFSATLTPINYFVSLLIRDIDYEIVEIPSPFPIDNLKLIIRPDIKTTYKERSRYYSEVANIITKVRKSVSGNYMVFFPSYKYMDEVAKLIECDVLIQKPRMSEIQRAEYLNEFENKKSILSFAITGGVFSEGIDLVGDKLIGVIVVGVGLPQISIKNNILKDRYNYQFAYTYPGFNKVQQAIGRLIRHEDDRGVAILIDERFNTSQYRSLYPNEWSNSVVLTNDDDTIMTIKKFWE
ncbi:ATP-dependent DNA helicase [Thiospirochaeta perfilievii]|uniref:ATP-dependent DNA helicase n=1 Tax=Thiospirochaeta perfilievii TaxID=252967 RepID=A0A5C1QEM6_9SPIO|nr:helicase C-terminal domain-containing protein [Thiospirochaeta perfilievii]QEN05838.1 ATP-dependent DNA helicase [Thiospirochaeta perfilievii]